MQSNNVPKVSKGTVEQCAEYDINHQPIYLLTFDVMPKLNAWNSPIIMKFFTSYHLCTTRYLNSGLFVSHFSIFANLIHCTFHILTNLSKMNNGSRCKAFYGIPFCSFEWSHQKSAKVPDNINFYCLIKNDNKSLIFLN